MTYQSPTQAYAHQRRALEALRNKKVHALFMRQRTGKSKVTLDDWGEMEDNGLSNRLTVVAPGGVYRVWEHEINTHLDPKTLARTKVLTWNVSNTKTWQRELQAFNEWQGSKIFLVNVESLTRVDRCKALAKQFLQSGPSTLVIDESVIIKGHDSKTTKCINSELRGLAQYRRILSGLPDPKNPLDLYSQFEFLDPKILGFNSFFGFRGRFALTQKMDYRKGPDRGDAAYGFVDLSRAPQHGEFISLGGVNWEFVKANTGPFQTLVGATKDETVERLLFDLSNSTHPVIACCEYDLSDDEQKLLLTFGKAGVGGNRFTLGASHAAVSGPTLTGGKDGIQGFQPTVVTGFRDLDELNARISPYCTRVFLEDCYDMPESVWQPREVELTDEQFRAYEGMRKLMLTQLDNGALITATQKVTNILRLHQILCGFVKDVDGVIHALPEKRCAELLQLLDDTPGKVIIWCAYDYSIRTVSEALRKAYGLEAVAQFWGGNVNQREDEEARFKTSLNCRYMVATPAAGGRGRNWSVADTTVYHSCLPDLDDRDQSEERVKAMDKKVPALYIDLIARGKVEEKFLKLLRTKMDLSTAVHGDAYRSWLI